MVPRRGIRIDGPMRKPALLLLPATAGGGAAAVELLAELRSRSVPLPARIIPAPLVRQKTDYSCGNVAALSLLRYWKHEEWKQVPESALYGPMGTTSQDGTDPY